MKFKRFNSKLGYIGYTAFTLAEMLITLGIIGVVAAISIPNLINNSKETEYTNSLKKFYSDVSQAVGIMQAPGSEYLIPENYADQKQEAEEMRNNLCSIMQCIKKDTVYNVFGVSLQGGNPLNTVYKNYKSLSMVYTDIPDYYPAAILKNGMFFTVHYNLEARNSFQLYVDTNGAKTPNMFGQDFNMFEIKKSNGGYYRVIVEGDKNSYVVVYSSACSANQSSYTQVWPCSYYRLYEPDKLP